MRRRREDIRRFRSRTYAATATPTSCVPEALAGHAARGPARPTQRAAGSMRVASLAPMVADGLGLGHAGDTSDDSLGVDAMQRIAQTAEVLREEAGLMIVGIGVVRI